MISAREARERLRSVKEANDLTEIGALIDAAIVKGRRYALYGPEIPVTVLVKDILKDRGYTVNYSGNDAFGKEIMVCW